MATQWDEDDHLLDEMLDDDVDGWGEELTGLSSEDDSTPAAAEETSNNPAATAVHPCVTTTVGDSTNDKEEEENAWDFESDLAVDDDNESSAGTPTATALAADQHCTLAAVMAGNKDHVDSNQSFQQSEENQERVHGSAQQARAEDAFMVATRKEEAQRVAAGHRGINNANIGSVGDQNEHKIDERRGNNYENKWDFEDDAFNDENDEFSDRVNSEVVSTGDNRGQENPADKPPPPPSPLLKNSNTAADKPPPPRPPVPDSSHGEPTRQTIPPQQVITNPFLSHDKMAASDGNNGKHLQDDDGDGWSDDEAFFNDDVVENLPVMPSKALSRSPPLPPPSTHHNQQQQNEAELPFTDATQLKIHQMLLTYLSNITKSQFLLRLHSKLHSPNNTAASNLREYYATRPGLKKYTLGVELDRMDYSLLLPGGKCLEEKDVIRSYFGVGPDGGSSGHEQDSTTPSVEEVLIRSANQSLLADALVALTGSEEVLLDSSDEFHNHGDAGMSLILSGPMLSMTSVAETCNFVVDLERGVVEATCVLAIGVPFHNGDLNGVDERIVDKGRLVLARTRVSVRFRPGNGDVNGNDESTVQYVVQSIEPSFFCPEESTLLRRAAISLALDQNDPFFQGEEEMLHLDKDEGTTDVRDLFLLNHHLLSDSHLLAVSDHLVRLRGAAEASSTGFRSALRQLDGVTNVSGKLSLIKNATGGRGGGVGGFLALPSAQEIEAAEREAADSIGFAHAGPSGSFPRPPNHHNHKEVPSYGQRPPPPPPPPMPPKIASANQDGARPRPLIGGMFLSGLSRLAAAATQPDNEHRNLQWADGGGTGLTPPSSPRRDTHSSHASNQPHVLHRREEHPNSLYNIPQWDGTTGGTGLTPSTVYPSRTDSTLVSSHTHSNDPAFFSNEANLKDETKVGGSGDEGETMEDADEKDGGWSDDGLDFEDEDQDNDKLDHNDPWEDSLEIHEASNSFPANTSENIQEAAKIQSSPFVAPTVNNDHMLPSQPCAARQHVTEASLKYPKASLKPPHQPGTLAQHRPESTPSFEEEFVIVLKEKIEEDEREMRESGRMKRWRPISEDPIRRQRLIEVMVNQLDGHY
ncbi:hypothetical protein HJC23_006038 [Cyclotella cryptica]|uniref:Uncharacterized protein n=1 Tax=Cyclotella cryptica TaxID=29204 RepID=A0ABD3PUP9_9STRA|eukprot:CCRYP_011326-RA/>CCRYP_011326-RA protein AED:0.07 eAED:0.02 QI:0/-1/0/1/-1/1/1/0/1091